MLQEIQDEDFFIVFTTAYDNYALNSFEEDVVDYLLKPIAEERLQKTIEKIRALRPSVTQEPIGPFWEKLNQVLARFSNQYMQRIQVRIGEKKCAGSC